MASIQNSRAKKYARLTSGDEPTENLESAGDRLIKELAEKQTDTKLTLEKQFHQEKQFRRGCGFVSLNSFSAGTSSLEDFQKKTKDAETLQQLTAHGLTLDEAKKHISGQNILYSSKAESSAQQAQQELLAQYLQDDAQDNKNINTPRLGRQEQELGLSVKPNSVETQLLQFALSCKRPGKIDLRPAAHPINHLVEIEKELLKEHIDPLVLAKTVNRKRRQQLDALLPSQHISSKPLSSKASSLWDVIDKPVIFEEKKPKEVKVYGCNKQRLYTIKDGKIVEVKAKNETGVKETSAENYVYKEENANYDGQPFVTKRNIEGNSLQNGTRLSETEIKEMPKFKNYECGKLNKTLYIKNIASSVKEEDLVSIFCKFQEPEGPKIVYRLMNGKMRGQAFISFPSVEKAVSALDSVNGIVVKGKPLIIQFGKDTNG